jgi:osmotically-inducible protein OsmY
MRTPLILIVLVAALLQGCAAVVATGAATGAVAIYDRRTTGIMLEDQNIELKTASRLRSDPAISEQAHINTVPRRSRVACRTSSGWSTSWRSLHRAR